MKNLGAKPEEMKVYFPLGLILHKENLIIPDFQVWVDKQPVPVTQVNIPDEKFEELTYASAVFPVTFPPGQDVNIHVTYSTGTETIFNNSHTLVSAKSGT